MPEKKQPQHQTKQTYRTADDDGIVRGMLFLWRWRTEILLFLPLVVFGLIASDPVRVLLAVGVAFVLGFPQSRRWLKNTLHAARVRRQWTPAVVNAGAAPMPTTHSRRKFSRTGPRATNVQIVESGEIVKVKIGKGSSFQKLEDHAEDIGANLSRRRSKVRDLKIERDPEDLNRAIARVRRRDPFDNRQPIPWPLLHAEKTSVHDPMPIGIDEDGETIYVEWKAGDAGHTMICGITGSGKSAIAQQFISHTALDPTARLLLADPNLVQFQRWEGCAAQNVVGPSPVDFLRLLESVQRVMDQRFNAMLTGTAWKASKKTPTITLVIDELPRYLNVGVDKETRTRIIGAFLDIIQRSRTVGIRIISIVQRPSTEIISGDLRAQFPNVIGLRVDRGETSRMIFGHNNSPAHEIKQSQKGVGYLGQEARQDRRFLGFWVSEEDVERIAKEASDRRMDHDLFELAPPPTPPTPSLQGEGEPAQAGRGAMATRAANTRALLLRELPWSEPGLNRKQIEALVSWRQAFPVLKQLMSEGLVVRGGSAKPGSGGYTYRRHTGRTDQAHTGTERSDSA